jgi:predicted hydrolase (HD superfamily)
MHTKRLPNKKQQKSFAANVTRDDIMPGAADLGIELNEHSQFVIEAMRTVAVDYDLHGGRRALHGAAVTG